MIELTVFDPGTDEIVDKIIARLREYGGASPAGNVVVRRVAALSSLLGVRTEILVVSSDVTASDIAGIGRVACGIALLPGDIETVGFDAGALNIEAGCVVTYGMSPKNTLTLSSICEDSCVVALQRELLTASGDVLERQELRVRGGMKPETLMAVTGALLVCGVKLSDENP
jgi:hypothetical protein